MKSEAFEETGVLPKTPDYMTGEMRQYDPLPPRVTKGLAANYQPATYDPAIDHGLTPYGPNVLIKMDECMEVTMGGIQLLADKVEQMNEACFTGCIFKIGPDAFRGLIDRPHVGQRVFIERYSGIKVTGKDGKMYRVVDEKCIACTIADDLCVSEV